MLTGVVCYIERAPGGNALRRIRLVGPELDQSWVAPSATDDDATRTPAPGEQLGHIRSAAAWIAEELTPLRELAAVCLDAEGGVCSWVSSPSSDPKVLMAAIRQVGGPAPAPTESTSPSTGFGLLPDDALGMGSGRSVQALAEPETATATLPLAKAGAKQPQLAPRRRMGVLSVADAPVRVLLDELDRLKIGVGAVLSFWHAAALAWDPSVQRAAARQDASRRPDADTALEPIVVEPAAPITATVLVDPTGRLSWGWSRAGELLAAGSLRLRTHTYTRAHAPETREPIADDTLDAGLTRRLAPEEPAETIHATECSPGDVGRLVMDWLSWSVQIGQTPDRIVCIGPPTIPQRPGASNAASDPLPSPGAVAQALGGAWPSASVDAAASDDPIGATLNRLRVLPMFQPAGAKGAADAAQLEQDPRKNLVNLTRRPGRLTRTTHIWATLAILAAAVALFMYARRLGSGVADVRARTAAVEGKRTELLQGVEDVIPALSKSPDPVGMLSGKIGEISEQLKVLNRTSNLLPKVLPVLEILQDPEFSQVELTNISVNDLQIRVSFTVPETDDLTPAALRDRLDKRFGAGVWSGNWGVIQRGRRPYEVYWSDPGGRP